MSTDRGTRNLRPNSVLISKREERGWTSRRRAARELYLLWKANFPGVPDIESIEKTLYRHETGRVQVRDEAYRRLYCLAYDASPHDLFGDLGQRAEACESDEFVMRSHKFIAAFVGPDLVEHMRETVSPVPDTNQWLDCFSVEYPSSDGDCTLYLWPFGAVIFHLVEDVAVPSLAALAVWRYRSYQENLAWATRELCTVLDDETLSASYVLSAYWIHKLSCSVGNVDTALRILCMPKVLLDRSADGPETLNHAELVERALLVNGFSHPDLRGFGMRGISIGYASWSGVVYHPIAEQRCLAERELVAAELATQSLWSYCAFINGEVEKGRDPPVPARFGWRFLRGARSLLTNPRPQEIEQHRSMRIAIVETSGLDKLLAQATEILRETER